MTFTPHDKAAFTGALLAAAKHLDEQARVEFVEWAKSIGVKSAEPKLGGTMTIAARKERIAFKADEFEAWVKEHQPHNIETVERVRPAAEKAIERDLHIVAGEVVREVVDPETGEVAYEPFPAAVVVPGGAPYASWRGGDEPKAEVTRWLAERLEVVAELLAGDMKAVES